MEYIKVLVEKDFGTRASLMLAFKALFNWNAFVTVAMLMLECRRKGKGKGKGKERERKGSKQVEILFIRLITTVGL